MRQPPAIRQILFRPPAGDGAAIEITTAAALLAISGPDEFVGPQLMAFDIIVQVTAGSTRHTVDFQRRTVREGDVVWVRAGQVHEWGDLAAFAATLIFFADTAVPDFAREAAWRAPSFVRRGTAAASNAAVSIEHLASCLRRGADYPDRLHAELARAALACVLVHLVRDASNEPDPTDSAARAYLEMRRAIDTSFRTERSVASFAARIGYSTRTVNRLARAFSGQTAKQLIDARVVLEARRLLAHDRHSVTAIAAQLGFDDPANFSAYFRARTGESPRAFRDRHR